MTHLDAIALLEALRARFGAVEMERSAAHITYWLQDRANLPTVPTLAKWSAGLGLGDGAVWGNDSRRGIFLRIER